MKILKKIKKLKRIFDSKAVVLCYHRIATPEVDAWELSVSPQHFEEQLKVLQELNLAAPVSDVTDRLQQKKIKKNVVITFDDGYIDNYITAMPLLIKYKIPATFFFTSRNIGTNKEFWWDELENIFLLTKELPRIFTLSGTQTFEFDLKEESTLSAEMYQKHTNFSAYYEPPTKRSELYIEVWKLLFSLEKEAQEEIMYQIRQWAGLPESSRPDYCCMSKGKIKELADHSLFTIGGHTENHPSLRHLPKQKQFDEIKMNKAFLEEITDKQVNYFAYPSGSFNNETIETLIDLGIKSAFTTEQKAVYNNADHYKISRFQAPNCTGQEFKQKLQKWLRY